VSIDALDLRLLELLNQRTRVVEEIGRVKRTAKLPIYEPRREDQVFENITAHNGGRSHRKPSSASSNASSTRCAPSREFVWKPH